MLRACRSFATPRLKLCCRTTAKPIFSAAGFGTGRVTVRIVRNESFNAFVVDGANVFINTGTLLQA